MTFLEKLIQEEPEYYEQLSEHNQRLCLFGCPCNHFFEKDPFCPSRNDLDMEKYDTMCVACWNREIPEEKPEAKIELIAKGVQKKMKLAELIRDTVLNAICDRDIEEAVKDAFEEYDYSDLISSAVEEYLHYNIADIASEIVEEAVHEYFTKNL